MGKKKIPVKTGGKQVERDKRGKFLPGSKANPNGRPKGSISITTIIKRLLQDEQVSLKDGKKITAGIALSKKVLFQALTGDMTALKLIWNYVDGMPKQSVGVESEGLNVIISYADGKRKGKSK